MFSLRPARPCLDVLVKARLGSLLAWQASVCFAPTARAATPVPVALEYEVSPDAKGCPAPETFRAAVGRQLGHDPFRPISDRRVAVQITGKEKGFAGVIRWSDANGRWVGDRQLSSRRPDCDGIAADLAFSVAVQIQLLETLAPATPEAPAAPAPPVASLVPPGPPDRNSAVSPPTMVVSSPAPRAPPAGTRLQLSLGLGPALAIGLLPRSAAVGRMFVSGRVARFSLEIAIDAALPSEQQQVDGSGFSLDRFAASAAACGHAHVFAACVTTVVGLLRARGFGVDEPASPAGMFSQVGGRLAATRGFGGRYFVQARVDGLVMLSSQTVILNQTTVWTTPRLGALLGVDLGARLF
jgi:hypothetical protein